MGQIARLLLDEHRRRRNFDHLLSLESLARGINARATVARGTIRRWFVLDDQPAPSSVTRSSRRTFAERK